jgi:hypothetical protein
LAFIHRQDLQLIHDPRAHLHQLMPVPQPLSQVTILRSSLTALLGLVASIASRGKLRVHIAIISVLILLLWSMEAVAAFNFNS